MVKITRWRVITVLLLAMLAFSFHQSANATDSFVDQVQGQQQLQKQQIIANPQAGSVVNKERLQIPGPGALGASSSNTTAQHRYLDQRAVSVLFFSHQRTTMKFDVVSFITSGPTPRQELAACSQEEDFRAFRKYEGNPCSPVK